eukprot:UN00269
MDTIGIMAGWRFLDHAGHLGGFVFGSLYWYMLLQSENANSEDGEKIFINDGSIYEGPIKDYKAVGPGTIKSPTWTYYGELDENENLSGDGCLRSELHGWVWSGEI